MHCLERRSKALKYISSDVTVFDEITGKFEVKGSSEKHHTVFFEDPSCTCHDWTEWNLPCKHFFCIFELYPQWNWDRLPDRYTKSTYLSTNQAALNNYFSPSVELHFTTVMLMVAMMTSVNYLLQWMVIMKRYQQKRYVSYKIRYIFY